MPLQLEGIKLEDMRLHWAEFQENWTSAVDRIVLRFPETERQELLKLNGELGGFIRYLAKVHELTFSEAADAVEFVLLREPGTRQQTAHAA